MSSDLLSLSGGVADLVLFDAFLSRTINIEGDTLDALPNWLTNFRCIDL